MDCVKSRQENAMPSSVSIYHVDVRTLNSSRDSYLYVTFYFLHQVSEFPSCVCRMCRKEKKAKKAYPYKVSISRQTSATNDYLNGVELRAVDVVKPVNVL